MKSSHLHPVTQRLVAHKEPDPGARPDAAVAAFEERPVRNHDPRTPRRMAFSVSSRNQRSAMFSHELDVGMKCRWNRGCLSSQATTLSSSTPQAFLVASL